MEESVNSPIGMMINSVDINKKRDLNIAYLKKKRKFQSEQLGMPSAKHKCSDKSFDEHCDILHKVNRDDGFANKNKGNSNYGCVRVDESEPESARDSNSFKGYSDSMMSNSGEVKADLGYSNTCSSSEPSSLFTWSENMQPSSSSTWTGDTSNNVLFSLESRSITKSCFSAGEEYNSLGHNLETDSYLNFEDPLLEFGCHIDCNCLECKGDSNYQCTEKELDDVLYSNGIAPNNYVLSSGRWTSAQDTRKDTKQLTIDKEFEQYFSTLML